MFCNNCGKEIANNIAFCNNCGAPVKPTVQQNMYQTAQPNVQQNAYQNPQPTVQQNAYQNPQPNVQQNTYQSTQANINYGSEAAEAEFLKKLNGIGCLGCLLTFNIVGAFIDAMAVALFICFYVFTKKRKIVGPILGFVASGIYFFNGILYFLGMMLSTLAKESPESNLFSAIFSVSLGVAVLSDCIVMYKYLKNSSQNNMNNFYNT